MGMKLNFCEGIMGPVDLRTKYWGECLEDSVRGTRRKLHNEEIRQLPVVLLVQSNKIG
jgi:hypothetical protein